MLNLIDVINHYYCKYKTVNRLNHSQTNRQFDEVIKACRDTFYKKNKDYGPSWRILRPSSITDQIFIKAQRIRSIEEKGVQRIPENINDEYAGIINYCIIALIQMGLSETEDVNEIDKLMSLYDSEVQKNKELMLNKNHDYGEAWRDMRVSTFTDLILTKILRIKQIEDNQGKTLISEGADANYRDIMNYAIFALIRLQTEA